MKIIAKHFLTLLRRFKTVCILNVIGLSIAFAAFMLIMIQVSYESGYGKTDAKYKRIFRLEAYEGVQSGYTPYLAGADADRFVVSSPNIEHFARFRFINRDITIERNGEKHHYNNEVFLNMRDNLSKIFDFHMKEGLFPEVLLPGEILLPERLAKKYFGDQSAVGQTLWIDNEKQVEVTGVYYDMPENATLCNAIIHGWADCGNMYRSYYCLLKDPQRAQETVDLFVNQPPAEGFQISPGANLRLLPVCEAYFNVPLLDTLPHGSRETTYLLFTLALVVILVAMSNFINFSTALAPIRRRNINLRRITGESLTTLRISMVFEAVGICLIAYLVAIYLALIFTQTSWSGVLKATDVSLWYNWSVVLWTGGVALLVGTLAGLYPAFYTTSFQPVLALKGSSASTPGGKRLRTITLLFQATVSTGLIIFAAFIALQNRYVKNYPLGYDPTDILTVSQGYDFDSTLMNRLSSIPEVLDVSYFNGSFGLTAGRSVNLILGHDTVSVSLHGVDSHFLDFMKIPLAKGRNLLSHDPTIEDIYQIRRGMDKATIPLIIDRNTAQRLRLNVDTIVPGVRIDVPFYAQIVGISESVIGSSLYEKTELSGFVHDNFSPFYVYIKLAAPMTPEVLQKIRTVLDDASPRGSWTGVFSTHEQRLEELYRKHHDFGQLILLFSMLSILISLVGIFGLITFETQYRTKEIGLRKINGATTPEILGMFNRYFLWITAVGCCIAVPLAYYSVRHWLEGFAYRIPMHGWVFVAVCLGIIGFTLLTVTIRCWRTANANPIHSIKTE